jgi:hypothetical protein
MQTYHQNGFAHASDDTGTLFIDYCFLRCSRTRLNDPSQFIKSAWIRPEDLAVYEAMGYTTFKLLERGIPSAELLRRVKAYSERRFDGNLAELLLSYGFKQPVRKESLWSLRHFWKPRQVNPLRLKPMLDLARLQGWLSPLPECPIRVDARKIPEDFLDGFRNRDCASLDCQTCGYCERIAAQAVSIPPEYRTEVLKKYAEMDDTMVTGRLWGVTRAPRQSAQFPANETVLEGGDGHGGKPAVPAGSIGGAGVEQARAAAGRACDGRRGRARSGTTYGPGQRRARYPIDRYPIIPSSAPNLLAEVRKEFSLGHDVLRHVYISMHVAKFRSMGDTALQAGNSEAIIKKHYLNLMTPEEADAFWKIVPASRLADTSLRCCRDFRPLGAGRCSSLPVSQLSKKEV